MTTKFNTLTRKAISSLEPGKTLRERGIVAERTSNGDVRYSVNVMVDGIRIHRIIGRASEGVTRTQAEQAIAQFRSQARESRLNLPKGRKTHRSFSAAAEEYLKRLAESGGKDLTNKRRHLSQQLIPEFRNAAINKLTTFAVSSFAARRSSHASTATTNRELSTLSHMLSKMVEWKWIEAGDKPKIVKGREARKPIRVLTEQDVTALMEAAKNDSDARLHLFVAFGLNTAMRHSEIVRARYDQVDFENRRLRIPKAKGGDREQPITQTLADLLARHRGTETDPNGWIFPVTRRSKDPHRRDFDDAFRRAVIASGLEPGKVTPHVMRHTAITRLVKAGIDLPTVARISGHKTMAMVLRYTHVYGDHIDKAIAALEI